MNLSTVLAGLALSTLPALALEAPATFEDARVEVKAGVTPAAALEQAAKDKGTTWVGWSVTAIPKLGDVCCFSDNFKGRGCSLAERESSWGTTDTHKGVSPEVYILVETKDGDPNRVKIFSPDCHVDGHDRRVVWLGPVEAQASLATLDRLVDRNDKKVSETALVAIAYHGDAKADALLEKRALDRSLRSDVREQAIFWSGQTRGESGLKTLDRVMATETDGDLRQNAVFAMSQSDEPSAVDRIKRVAVEDKDPDVRGHAYFSLSQTKAAGNGEWIVGRIDAERDEDVRDQAVFALSQLDDGTDWLLKVLRSNRDPATVRKALFWLGQSDDPRALREIERILDR
jgi:hypothetical protein